MDTGCHGTERSWPLLSTQYADRGLVYIDDVLIHGKTDPAFLTNTRRVFDRLCDKNVAVNPRKIELGLEQVEYVGHLVFTTSTSFTPEKRLKVLGFPEPTIQKAILQSIGLANYFRDHVSDMTDLVNPSGKLVRTTESFITSKL
jgi:hypothetical protein